VDKEELIGFRKSSASGYWSRIFWRTFSAIWLWKNWSDLHENFI